MFIVVSLVWLKTIMYAALTHFVTNQVNLEVQLPWKVFINQCLIIWPELFNVRNTCWFCVKIITAEIITIYHYNVWNSGLNLDFKFLRTWKHSPISWFARHSQLRSVCSPLGETNKLILFKEEIKKSLKWVIEVVSKPTAGVPRIERVITNDS